MSCFYYFCGIFSSDGDIVLSRCMLCRTLQPSRELCVSLPVVLVVEKKCAGDGEVLVWLVSIIIIMIMIIITLIVAIIIIIIRSGTDLIFVLILSVSSRPVLSAVWGKLTFLPLL